MSSVPFSFYFNFIKFQFRNLEVTKADYSGKTVIVTGANSGIGLEVARHFARLNAAHLILACRSTDKGETAKADISASLPDNKTAIEVWPLDLCSFESVRAFCRRADQNLDRLDVVVANAAVFLHKFTAAPDAGGYENTIATNVISTLLLSVMILPTMRKTATRFNVTPVLSLVVSEAHYFAKFKERSQPRILESFKTDQGTMPDRYFLSKLLLVLLGRELASHTGDAILINMVNPGFCKTTNIFNGFPFLEMAGARMGLFFFGRTAEMGARAVMSAVDADRSGHGKYFESGQESTVSPYVGSDEGAAMQRRLWEELVEIFEGIEPGVMKGFV